MIFLSVGLSIVGVLAGWFANTYRNKKEKETIDFFKKNAPEIVSNMGVITRFNMIVSSVMLKDPQKELAEEYRGAMVRLKSYFDSRDLTFNEGIRFIVKEYMERHGI